MKKVLHFIMNMDGEQIACTVLVFFFTGEAIIVLVSLAMGAHLLPVMTPWFEKP
jgi:hypothetical protein